jgi:kinesin family member 2/24
MMGTQDGKVPGLYLLASYDVIDLLNQYSDLELHISFFEIYCGKLYDLLNNREVIFCREDAKQQVNIINLTEVHVHSVQEIMSSLSKGLELRASGQTGANADSSRSHAILTLSLKHNKREYSKMSFIDLAGNERGADTMTSDKQTQLDGAEINKSLLALKECIRALDLSKKHTPFRGSKLTQVLKDSFIGNSKTTMIANISPASANVEHTLNTLRYADRVKELKKGEKGTKEDIKMKEMMLARQKTNTR